MTTPKVYVICDQNCKFESMTKEQILAAIVQAVENGTVGDIDTGFVQTIKTINGISINFFYGEQSEYDALPAEKKKHLFPIITNDTSDAWAVDALKDIEELQKFKYNFISIGDTAPESVPCLWFNTSGAKPTETAAVMNLSEGTEGSAVVAQIDGTEYGVQNVNPSEEPDVYKIY